MITVGPMALNQPQAADSMEPFFLGTQSGGGYHTDMSRISSHDHSGGLMGAAVAVSIPDGSITAADLDPSVLLPYALTDGSKPFTGQVTMQADAVVRDALYFGQQGTALAPDVTLSRTGAGALRVDNSLGVGVNPAAWNTATAAVQVGGTGALSGNAAAMETRLWANSYVDGPGTTRALAAGAAALATVSASGFVVHTAPSVAAGAVQTFTTRASIAPTGTLTLTPDAGGAALAMSRPEATGTIHHEALQRAGVAKWFRGVDGADGHVLLNATFVAKQTTSQTGTLTLTPDAGQAALVAGVGGGNTLLVNTGIQQAPNSPRLQSPGATWIELDPGGNGVVPSRTDAVNLGFTNARWFVVYAQTGTISTSSATVKEGLTPLSPERAMQAVRDTEAVTFDYVAPTRGPEWYDLPDDPEQAEQVLQQRLTAAPLEAAARHQHGFIAEQADELFLVGEGQTSPGSSIGVLLAALQNLDQRLAALETP